MPRNIREHILQTASGLFYRHGIKATGIDAIVKASGVAKMSLYKYFPAKDDLVVAHLQNSKHSVLARIEQVAAADNEPAAARLLEIFEVFSALLANPEFRGCPFINAAAESADASQAVQDTVRGFAADLQRVLANLAKEAGITAADALADQLSMLISGAIVSAQMLQRRDTMGVAAKAAAELIKAAQAASRQTATDGTGQPD